MKTIGILGGLGPEATVVYYNGIINAFKTGDFVYPQIIIYSVNMSEFIGLMKEKRYDEAAGKLVEKTFSLKEAGADFAAISSNTPHMLFDKIKARAPLHLVSILESTALECTKKGLKRPGLMGTGFTMNATFFQEALNLHGIEVILPDEEDRNLIDYRIFSEIELGIFNDSTRHELISITEKMVREKNIDSLILGCTELSLIMTDPVYAGIPMLDTTMIHVGEIVRFCRE
jgi:aspartate racemase